VWLVGRPIRVGRTPVGIAVGHGSVWVANIDDGTVSRLDARNGRPQGKPILVSKAQVLAVAVGEDGVWPRSCSSVAIGWLSEYRETSA